MTPCATSTVSENFPGPALRPRFAERAHANARSVFGTDQRVRSDLVIDLEQTELGGRQPGQRLVDVARKNLPARAIMQFDDVALGMFEDPHGLGLSIARWGQPGSLPQGLRHVAVSLRDSNARRRHLSIEPVLFVSQRQPGGLHALEARKSR